MKSGSFANAEPGVLHHLLLHHSSIYLGLQALLPISCYIDTIKSLKITPKNNIAMWKTGNIYLITAIAVIGGGLFGFDIASMSAIISTQPYLCYFNQGPDGPGYNDVATCSGPKSAVQGGITASMAGGSWFGALISGFLSDKLGRKQSIMVGSVVW